jgi:pseudaminic acid cytidylyltransferase
MKIAVIPARGGSKRIPRKNIKLFHGKPIIAYSIEVAIDSGLFDKVIVSTDDQEIANIAETYGAEIPFLRPSDISDDYASTNDVVVHAIKWYQKENIDLETVCCIYATSPFLQKMDLVKAREFPHARSVKAIEALALWRGATVGNDYAEAFVLARKIN